MVERVVQQVGGRASSISATAANAAVPSPDSAAARASGDHDLVAADTLGECWAPAFSSSP
ncbi:hypothetical protein ACFV4E_15335 [Streptomyces hygroscopicus]|uniref:Uncharacterized protein n=1 Tax=Streptomyces demainii TaxID=588122 RepID=A0ABT9KHL0_9ACTN|nr:hypothetical protein [Streptomyces demainii]MDP9607894.1 hypothetical protein [Streptomyces demainii]